MPSLSKALAALGTAASWACGSPLMPDDGKQGDKGSRWYQDEGLHPLNQCRLFKKKVSVLQRQQPQIQGDPRQVLGRWRLEAQGSIRRHGEEPQDEKRWSFAGEESNSQGEVRWALFSRMCLKAGWEKQLRFSSLRDYLSLTFRLSSVPLLQGSVFCWLIHNTQPKGPILQRGQESSKVTTKPLQSSGDRSPLPTPHPILTFPH